MRPKYSIGDQNMQILPICLYKMATLKAIYIYIYIYVKVLAVDSKNQTRRIEETVYLKKGFSVNTNITFLLIHNIHEHV